MRCCLPSQGRGPFSPRRDAWRGHPTTHVLRNVCLSGHRLLTKGVVGLGIPALGMGVYLLWSRRRASRFFGWHMVVGSVLIAGAGALWLWLLWREGGRSSLDTFLVYNQLGRFFPDAETYQGGHVRPLWYYVLTTCRSIAMDSLPRPCRLVILAQLERLPEIHREGVRLCVAGTLPVLLALSLAGTKRGMYLLPVFPLIALFVASWTASTEQTQGWMNKL